MAHTYNDLRRAMEMWTPEQREQEVTVRIGDDFHPITSIGIATREHTLDTDHVYMETAPDVYDISDKCYCSYEGCICPNEKCVCAVQCTCH